jgi:hypothetical protein
MEANGRTKRIDSRAAIAVIFLVFEFNSERRLDGFRVLSRDWIFREPIVLSSDLGSSPSEGNGSETGILS